MRTLLNGNDRAGHANDAAGERQARDTGGDSAAERLRNIPTAFPATNRQQARPGDSGKPLPTSLLNERLNDNQANCLELAVREARPGQDELVFLNDEAEADGNDAGHVLIRDKQTGRVWDPSGKELRAPADSAQWEHAGVDSWIESQKKGSLAAWQPEPYAELGAADASQVRDILTLAPGEQRAQAIAESGDETLQELQGRSFADGKAGDKLFPLIEDLDEKGVEKYLKDNKGKLPDEVVQEGLKNSVEQAKKHYDGLDDYADADERYNGVMFLLMGDEGSDLSLQDSNGQSLYERVIRAPLRGGGRISPAASRDDDTDHPVARNLRMQMNIQLKQANKDDDRKQYDALVEAGADDEKYPWDNDLIKDDKPTPQEDDKPNRQDKDKPPKVGAEKDKPVKVGLENEPTNEDIDKFSQ